MLEKTPPNVPLQTMSLMDFLMSLQQQALINEVKLQVLEDILMTNAVITREQLDAKYKEKSDEVRKQLEEQMNRDIIIAKQSSNLILPK